jgi:hypothetical protein
MRYRPKRQSQPLVLQPHFGEGAALSDYREPRGFVEYLDLLVQGRDPDASRLSEREMGIHLERHSQHPGRCAAGEYRGHVGDVPRDEGVLSA